VVCRQNFRAAGRNQFSALIYMDYCAALIAKPFHFGPLL
jgi:hypothetical protein